MKAGQFGLAALFVPPLFSRTPRGAGEADWGEFDVGSSIIVVLPLLLIAGGIAVMVFIFALKAGLFHEHITPIANDQAAQRSMTSDEAFEANDDNSVQDVA
ncbi:MAG: hypothetical protein QF754_20530 [Alphaproteobacteria bacterium]|jgi:hypothetical protein|nr:hypothetical protein [Alphaproteobacteria bacterium]|tara:strand:- start:129 stop:431 length:303 start_codon:yes stop_codon:yes gene_type:complete